MGARDRCFDIRGTLDGPSHIVGPDDGRPAHRDRRRPRQSGHGHRDVPAIQRPAAERGRPLVRGRPGNRRRRASAAAHVDFPASSVAYLRWFWSQIEPQRGTYRWSIIDDALAEAHRHGQRLAIRIMPYDDKHAMPDWYIASGAKRANAPTDKDGAIWSPDADDPLYAQRLGARWSSKRASATTAIRTSITWTSRRSATGARAGGRTFRAGRPAAADRPLLHGVPAHAAADEFRCAAGAAIRREARRRLAAGLLGRHGRAGPQLRAHEGPLPAAARARRALQDAWQTRPVALETCGSRSSGTSGSSRCKPILDQALRWHASTINIKSSRIPADWKAGFDEFQKQIGYRFVLKKLEYPSQVTRGSMAAVNMWWFNAGVAPVYRSYTLALAIGDTVIPLDADIRQWLPGDAVVRKHDRRASRPRAGPLLRSAWRCSTRRRDARRFGWRLQAGRPTGGIRSARSS